MYIHTRGSLKHICAQPAICIIHAIRMENTVNSSEGTVLSISIYLSIYTGDAIG